MLAGLVRVSVSAEAGRQRMDVARSALQLHQVQDHRLAIPKIVRSDIESVSS